MKKPRSLAIELEAKETTTALVYSASSQPADAALVLAHGAGAGQHSPFMVAFAQALAALEIDIVTFNFLYTERGRRLPDRGPTLEACYRAVIGTIRRELESAERALVIGGKSMGGRIASQVAAADRDLPICGLVLLGYPLHPPGRPEVRRDAHLPGVGRPMLVIQGSRDGFGTAAELAPVLEPLSPRATLYTVEGGDHSFKLSRRDPAGQDAVHAGIHRAIARWIRSIVEERTPTSAPVT